ncbi:GNAT family N-acetyltransferase [Halobacteriovorax sp.]|uniref:GNAT family N-acetyltransferase n=1 Tax=Halobacteriovorax sp. TaxID=2020862 RepID=UPI00356926FA
MKVLRINASDTYHIRNLVLRPGRPVEDCHFEHDDDEQTFHLGAFIDSQLVSVASFYFEKNPKLVEEYQYRLRGMATLPEHRGKGLSSSLLRTAFPIIEQNFCQLLWCNARSTAQGFYQKVGFERTGEEFDVPTIGPHYLMFKTISQ